ncbi:carbohydrate esterase family 4 protein, partial [Piromyces sp. E2]
GYCGTTNDYCGSGCQSNYGVCSNNSVVISTDGHCGSGYGSCPSGQCCSKYGYCGTSKAHCGSGCQSSFGNCDSSSTPKPTTTTTTKYGRCGDYVSDLEFKYYYECKNPKHWALTFDDGPYDYDMELLDLLKKKGVKATFFINGNNVMDIRSDEGKEIVKRMYREGHVIGSHTWSHANLEEIDREEIKEEMIKLEDILEDYIGKKPALMRPPYGAGDGDDEIAMILYDLGYNGACMWNVDTLDWSSKGDVDYALKVFKSYLGKPILSLNHSFYQGITKSKLLTLAEEEIDYMISHGYTPVTIDVCLG